MIASLVLITCVAFLPARLVMVRTTTRELLERGPAPQIKEAVTSAVAEVRQTFDLEPRSRAGT